ncbi:MAG: tyrosine-type recombinase/integrase [Verrucomicrobiales bacterium]|jgi:integrase|nr:tyrosine-type recombinase/integrase [Verrucomicrobiales bacterium]
MASLHKRDGSDNWSCAYTDPLSGRRLLRTTGTSDKSQAMEICLKMESLAKKVVGVENRAVTVDAAGEMIEAARTLTIKAISGKLSEAEGREFINTILEKSELDPIKGETVEAYLKSWLTGKTLSKRGRTSERYATVIKLFLSSLGKRAKMPLSVVSARDVENFRDRRLKDNLSPTTVKLDVKIIRSVFNAARKQGIVLTNPADAVELPEGGEKERAPFTTQEVALLISEIIDKKSPWDKEWTTIVLLGYYVGMRIGDAVTLPWEAVDFNIKTITYTQAKTHNTLTVPMHDELENHLFKLADDTPSKLICPRLASRRIAGRSGLSLEFGKIIKKAGLDSMDSQRKSGRKFSARTFHSLRHSFTSFLANQGISDEIRMKLTGHTSKDVHQRYTHMEMGILQAAIDKLPSLK